jgi:hypothetical protein
MKRSIRKRSKVIINRRRRSKIKRSRSSKVRRNRRSKVIRSRRSKIRRSRSSKVRRNRRSKVIRSRRSKIRRNSRRSKIKLDIKIKETLDDGNCFYSSIYRSLKDKNLLSIFNECFSEIKSNTEKTFIKKLRSFIADNSEESITEMFSNFSNMELDEETFEGICENLGSISDVLIDFYNKDKFNPKYETQFIKKMQQNIKTNKNWVSELEVISFQNILENQCDIKLKFFNTDKKAYSDIKNDYRKNYNKYKNTIYLLNQDGVHWVYI